MFIYSYRGYTISHNILDNKYYIIYPNDLESSVYTYSLEKAYEFIDSMYE